MTRKADPGTRLYMSAPKHPNLMESSLDRAAARFEAESRRTMMDELKQKVPEELHGDPEVARAMELVVEVQKQRVMRQVIYGHTIPKPGTDPPQGETREERLFEGLMAGGPKAERARREMAR